LEEGKKGRMKEEKEGVQEHNLIKRSLQSRKRKGRSREVEKERRRVERYHNHIRRRTYVTFIWTSVSEAFSVSITR
jgi:hypothetical protein